MRNHIAGLILISLLGGAAWLTLGGERAHGGGVSSSFAKPDRVADQVANQGASAALASSRLHPQIAERESSPAGDVPWRASDVEADLLSTMLKNPASQFDVFDSIEWGPMNAWVAVPDIGGPWSLARRQCAAEKLGSVTQEPCDYMVNLVLRRRADGTGEVVGAIADFDVNLLAEGPDVHGPNPSLASARCQNFARCLVARGYAKTVAPMAPGPTGELLALQVAARELPKSDVDARERLARAIDGIGTQIAMLEADPAPGDLSWEFNALLLRRTLEYYKWLEGQL